MAGGVFRGKGFEEKVPVPGYLGRKTNSISELSTRSYPTAGCCVDMFIYGCTKEMGPRVLESGTSMRGDSGFWSMQKFMGRDQKRND